MDKPSLRKQYRAKLATYPIAAREAASRAIITKLVDTDAYRNAGTIFTYVATGSEVDTRPLIEQAWRDGKAVAVPRLEDDQIIAKQLSSWEQLQPGPFSIPEPGHDAPTIHVADLDLVIVPGLAFTRDGARLGHGRGHFDRWLATLTVGTPTTGLAFDFQIADKLPQESHDIRIQKVLTNS